MGRDQGEGRVAWQLARRGSRRTGSHRELDLKHRVAGLTAVRGPALVRPDGNRERNLAVWRSLGPLVDSDGRAVARPVPPYIGIRRS